MALPLILAGVSLGLEALGAVEKHRAASKQAAAQRRFATESLALERRDLAIRATEEKRATARAIDELMLEVGLTEGQIGASAAAGNVRGQSVRALSQDLAASQGREIETLQTQTQLTLDQLQRLREGAALRAQANISANQGPSLLATGLNIAGSALRAYTSWKGLDRNQPLTAGEQRTLRTPLDPPRLPSLYQPRGITPRAPNLGY